MQNRQKLAILGSGPTCIYLLWQILIKIPLFENRLRSISIFDKRSILGMGMPYSPETTDIYNLSNIASEEIPELPTSFYEWLLSQPTADLERWRIEKSKLSEKTIYSRIALGAYLRSQYETIIGKLKQFGIEINEYSNCNVSDVQSNEQSGLIELLTSVGSFSDFSKVIIATGHRWIDADEPTRGFFSSPWPIHKLLPSQDNPYNFTIGTLGASLSAFDAISSIAHRQGEFRKDQIGLSYHPHPGTENFRLIMHSSNGWLPHLQFEQKEALREIYRHVSREELLALIDEKGFITLDRFFDKVCRDPLRAAFLKDGRDAYAKRMEDPSYTFTDLVEALSLEHQYAEPFAGMRLDLPEALADAANECPFNWKETIDDLMFTLNYHTEFLPAEDYTRFREVVMPFVMNVVAALPLSSARILLALRDAGKLELVKGHVEIPEEQDETSTLLYVEDDNGRRQFRYRMFIDCGGQDKIDVSDYPFKSLVRTGAVRSARARFENPENASRLSTDRLVKGSDSLTMSIGGVDIDDAFRVVGQSGYANPRIIDLALPHIAGLRPYSYGLQACNENASIVLDAWAAESADDQLVESAI